MCSKFSVLAKFYKFFNFQNNGLVRMIYITPSRKISNIISRECGTNFVLQDFTQYTKHKFTRYSSSKESKVENKENAADKNVENCKIKSFRRSKSKVFKKAKINCKICKRLPLQNVNIGRVVKDDRTRQDAESLYNGETFPLKSKELFITKSKDKSQIQLPPDNIYIEFIEPQNLDDFELTKRPTVQRKSPTNTKQSDGKITNTKNGIVEDFTNTPQDEKVELSIPKLVKNTPKVETLSCKFTGISTANIGGSKNQPTVLFKVTNSTLKKSPSEKMYVSKNDGMLTTNNISLTKIKEKSSILPEKCGFKSTNCPKNMFGEYISPEKLKLKSNSKSKSCTRKSPYK